MSSGTQHATPRKFDEKRRTECLNTRFPLLILLYAENSVKLNILLLHIILSKLFASFFFIFIL